MRKGYFILFLFLISCSSAPVKEPLKTIYEPDRVLAEINKVNIPIIEKNTRFVRIPVEAKRPSKYYSQEEIEIKKSDTGYEIRLWLCKNTQEAPSLVFQKEIQLKIPQVGGHDIEIIGKNQKFLELIFIDDWPN